MPFQCPAWTANVPFMPLAPGSAPSAAAVISAIRDARFSDGVQCPRCGDRKVHRWGWFTGRQRYRCLECRRTFSDLTGTPAAYVKKLSRWHRYSACLSASMTVRRSALRVGINPTTAFRWRHRLLTPWTARPETLWGWIEISTIRIAYSEKGRRRPSTFHTNEQPRPPVTVIIVRDRRSHVLMTVCGSRPTATELQDAFAGRLRGHSTICVKQGPFGAFGMWARRIKACFVAAQRVRSQMKYRGNALIHVRRSSRLLVKWKDWMRRFHGVATKYLPNYLAWCVLLSRSARSSLKASLVSWPVSA